MWTQPAFTLDFTFLNMLLMMTYLLGTHTCRHACTHTYTHTHMHVRTHIHTCTCLYARMHTHTHVHVCMHTHTHTNMFLIPFPDLSVICLIFLALIRNEAVCCKWQWLPVWWETQLCRVSHLKKSGLILFFIKHLRRTCNLSSFSCEQKGHVIIASCFLLLLLSSAGLTVRMEWFLKQCANIFNHHLMCSCAHAYNSSHHAGELSKFLWFGVVFLAAVWHGGDGVGGGRETL